MLQVMNKTPTRSVLLTVGDFSVKESPIRLKIIKQLILPRASHAEGRGIIGAVGGFNAWG